MSGAWVAFDARKQCCFCGADNRRGAVGYAGERQCPKCGKGGDGEPDERYMFYKEAGRAALRTETEAADGKVLLPCAHCGGAADYIEFDNPEQDTSNFGGVVVVCAGCGVSTDIRFPIKEDVRPLLAETWNRRSASQPADATLRQVALELVEDWHNGKAKMLGVAALNAHALELALALPPSAEPAGTWQVASPWDGVPPHPDQTGWHWLRSKSGGGLWPWRWSDFDGGEGCFGWEDDGSGNADLTAQLFDYVQPLPIPPASGATP